MLTVKWQHIILAASGYAGTSRRIARIARNPGAQFAPPYRQGSWSGHSWRPDTELRGQAPESYSHPFFPADPFGNRTYEFEFWSINGLSSNGWSFRFDPDGGRAPLIGIGGQWTLKAKAWYAWDRNPGPGPGGPGEHGVEIDAFDFTMSNDFLPNDFVDIGSPDGAPDQSHPDLEQLTAIANQDGYISTENLTNPITITARKQFDDEHHLNRYQFSHWQVISRSASGSRMPEVNGRTITVHRQNKMKAYAFYHGSRQDIAVNPEVERPGHVYVWFTVVRDPGQVEDMFRPVVIGVDRNGFPIVEIGPDGNPRPVGDPTGPYVKQLVEMLHKRLES